MRDVVHGDIGLGCVKIVSGLCYTCSYLSMFFYYDPEISVYNPFSNRIFRIRLKAINVTFIIIPSKKALVPI